ncbi:MAG: acyl-protein synthetase [Pseudanabaena sp. CAN_BIN31]|nr:acyl-protein synthetase [Pseudanabaena sp. CAN_BIN31]
MRSIELLTEEMLSLPSISRALLAEKLIERIELATDPLIQATWTTEGKNAFKSAASRHF